jgi:hypothetical protein
LFHFVSCVPDHRRHANRSREASAVERGLGEGIAMHSKRIVLLTTLLSLAGAMGCGGSSGGGGGSTYSISGTVTGASDVTVTLSGASTATVTTDGSGSYTFSGLADGSYTVTPSKSGYEFSPASQAVTVSGGNETANFTASLITYTISGTVGGAPEGSTVSLSGDATESTTTNASGYYSFSGLANGSYTVTPSVPSYTVSPTSQPVTVSGGNETANFTATLNTYTISGTVTGTVGVTLTLSGASTGTATTDADGNYSLEGVPDGAYTVTPSKAGYTFSPASQDVTVSGANATVPEFTATLITYSISGTVTGASGVTVTLGGASTASALTDSNGNYSFTGLLDGSYTLTPSKAGYTFSPESLAFNLSGGDVAGQDFTAALITYSISGTVTGASEVTVSLSGASAATTTTDVSGNYTFSGLVNGSYIVTPSKLGYTFAPASRSVTVNAGDQSAQDFDATLATYTISGTVSSAAGLLPGVTVTLGGDAAATTSTNAQGHYEFTGLLNGAYTVTPSSSQYQFDPLAITGIEVTYSDMPNQDFTGTPVVDTYAISGTVRDEVGAPMEGVTVSLGGATTAYGTTGADGSYEFLAVVGGDYRVTPSLTRRAFSPASVFTLAANVTDLDFKALVWTGPEAVTGGLKTINGIWGDWAVGTNNVIFQRVVNPDTGIASWGLVTSPIAGTAALQSIWGSAPNDIWAVGLNGTILHYTDEGNPGNPSWTVDAQSGVYIPSGGFKSVSGTGSNVWAVGSSTVLRRIGGVWQPVTEGVPLDNYASVWVSDWGDVWIGGSYHRVYRYADGSWQTLTVPDDCGTTAGPSAIWGSARNDVWLAENLGTDNCLYRWNGEGVERGFGGDPNRPTGSIRAISGTGPNDVWAVGANGMILHWDGRGLDAWETPGGAAWQSVGGNGSTTNLTPTRTMSGLWIGPDEIRISGTASTFLRLQR